MKAELVATDQEWDARIGKADAFVDGAMALNQPAQQHATAAQKWLSPLEPPPPPPPKNRARYDRANAASKGTAKGATYNRRVGHPVTRCRG